MHIMHVTDTLAIGGKERMLVDIANTTVDEGMRVSVCVTRSGCGLAKELRSAIRLYVLGRRRRLEWLGIKKFVSLIKNEEIDLLHVHRSSSLAFAVLATKIRGIKIPVIFHDHSVETQLSTPAPLWLRFIARYCTDHYVGVCPLSAEWAKCAGIPEHKISVINNALDLTRIEKNETADIRKEFGIDKDLLIGVVVANIRFDKGIHILLEAARKTSYRRSLKILIVGDERNDKYVEACRRQAASSGLTDTVIFTGLRKDIIAVIKSADFLLIPSVTESGPLVLIEAMACAIPFVSTLTGGVARTVHSLGIPEFVAFDDAEAFAKAIDRLIKLTSEQRKERGLLGKRIASEHFDIRQRLPAWYEIYKRALKV